MNLTEQFKTIKDYFSPKIVAEVNNQYVKIAKIKGEKVPWHAHPNEDEMFYILEGSLFFEIENDKNFTMTKGDFFIVKINTIK